MTNCARPAPEFVLRIPGSAGRAEKRNSCFEDKPAAQPKPEMVCTLGGDSVTGNRASRKASPARDKVPAAALDKTPLHPAQIHLPTSLPWKSLISERAKTDAVYAQVLARLWLSVLAYNLGNLWRRLALPAPIGRWSLTSLQQRLVKTGGRLIKHARYYWRCSRRVT